jgi:hypothetical protein
VEPMYGELWEIGIKMGRSICGHEKVDARACRISVSKGKMLEHSWNADNLHCFYV